MIEELKKIFNEEGKTLEELMNEYNASVVDCCLIISNPIPVKDFLRLRELANDLYLITNVIVGDGDCE